MKVPRITIQTLQDEVLSVKKPTKEKIRHLYGQIGIDIFQGKTNISLKNKNVEQNFITKLLDKLSAIKDYIFDGGIEDYKPQDTLRNAMYKYMLFRPTFKDNEIYETFGEKGLLQLRKFYFTGIADKI